MYLKLSCFQLQIGYYNYVLCKLYGNQRAKTYSIYTKNKGIKGYYHRKLSNHKRRKRGRKDQWYYKIARKQ